MDNSRGFTVLTHSAFASEFIVDLEKWGGRAGTGTVMKVADRRVQFYKNKFQAAQSPQWIPALQELLEHLSSRGYLEGWFPLPSSNSPLSEGLASLGFHPLVRSVSWDLALDSLPTSAKASYEIVAGVPDDELLVRCFKETLSRSTCEISRRWIGFDLAVTRHSRLEKIHNCHMHKVLKDGKDFGTAGIVVFRELPDHKEHPATVDIAIPSAAWERGEGTSVYRSIAIHLRDQGFRSMSVTLGPEEEWHMDLLRELGFAPGREMTHVIKSLQP